MSSSRDAKRARHSLKKRSSRVAASHESHCDSPRPEYTPKLSAPRGLNINLSAAPIECLVKNTAKAHSKPVLGSARSNQPYNAVHNTPMSHSMSRRSKKRQSMKATPTRSSHKHKHRTSSSKASGTAALARHSLSSAKSNKPMAKQKHKHTREREREHHKHSPHKHESSNRSKSGKASHSQSQSHRDHRSSTQKRRSCSKSKSPQQAQPLNHALLDAPTSVASSMAYANEMAASYKKRVSAPITLTMRQNVRNSDAMRSPHTPYYSNKIEKTDKAGGGGGASGGKKRQHKHRRQHRQQQPQHQERHQQHAQHPLHPPPPPPPPPSSESQRKYMDEYVHNKYELPLTQKTQSPDSNGSTNNTVTTNSNSNYSQDGGASALPKHDVKKLMHYSTSITNSSDDTDQQQQQQQEQEQEHAHDADHDCCSSSSSIEMEHDEYLNEMEINEMIRSYRRISNSKSGPRAFSKIRRVSQKLFGLMESISLDNDIEKRKKKTGIGYDETDDDETDDPQSQPPPPPQLPHVDDTYTASSSSSASVKRPSIRRSYPSQPPPTATSTKHKKSTTTKATSKKKNTPQFPHSRRSEHTERERERPHRSSHRHSQQIKLQNLVFEHCSGDDEDDAEETAEQLLRGKASHDYHDTLRKYGYTELKVIAKSLQGIVIEAESLHSHDTDTVIIKITDKQLHASKISNKHGKALSVQEDIIKEKKLLMYLTANNPPSALTKFLGFFEDKYNYFLVMENGGSDFFDWIVQCHRWIREGKVSLKQWNLYIHDLMRQIVELLQWLHCDMNVCHLDISLENMLIKNNKYKSDGNGGVRLSRKMQLKFCDFGLAEFFHHDNDSFVCTKYVGKTHYKAPKVYGKRESFDARKADVWSLGVSFFMMVIGAPPYKLPLSSDDHFPMIQNNDVMAILKRWGRDHYVNNITESLLNQMLQIDEHKRISIHNLGNHPYFTQYNNHNANLAVLKRRSTQDIVALSHALNTANLSNNNSNSSSKKKKRKTPNPVYTNMMAAYHDKGALMESPLTTANGHGHGHGGQQQHHQYQQKQNVFQNLVMSQDDGQLFRYRKRKITSS